MIPVQLKLRNFMAYREASINFRGIHLAVLTGENGAGKSSLLDAITWTLWGKSRAGSGRDELIHLGQTEMEVEYAFKLGDNEYRIIRKRDSSGRGRSDLSFQVEDAGDWRTLTENKITSTQKKINQLLRLDYDTFINSAFLLQGRADEFTTKTASKRKEILSDILGLGIYDIYEKRAKKYVRKQKKAVTALEARIEQIEEELVRESEYRAELAAAEQEASESNQQLLLTEKDLDLLREQHRAINEKQRQLEDLKSRLKSAETDLAEIEETIAAAQTEIHRYQTILARRDEIETGLDRLKTARETVKDWDQRLQESVKLSERKHDLEKAFDRAKADLEKKLGEIRTTINHLSPKVAAIDTYRTQLQEAEEELSLLQKLNEEREADQNRLTALKEETARLKEKNKQLRVEMDEIKENLTQLEAAGSQCPVCTRPLDETHRAEVIAQFKEEGKSKGDAYRANQARLNEIESQKTEIQQKITEYDKQLRGLTAIQGNVARLKHTLEEAEAATENLEQAQTQEAALQEQLDTEAFASEVIADLESVKAELATLGYDEMAHRQAKAEVESLHHFEEEGHALAQAEARITAETKRLEKEQARQARLTKQVTADREKIAELETTTTTLPQLTEQLNQASAELNKLQREVRKARDKVAAAHQKLGHITYLAKQRGELEAELQKTRELQGIYQELQVAFGKKGVQALLIESAIPEIESEANELLNRMTDSRMHIRFETQREAKSSDNTIETLDIRISDEVGTRNYELYSGGEAFRVNFAIRMALSKVLARRAGAQLQTLVIDEGFGTQDAQGRERLVDAINAIQEDFAKIIVITHIEELKDAFPVRIEVWKEADGSHIAIR